jgi:flagellar biosynthetic protein FliR
MPTLEPILPHVLPASMVIVRMTGLFIFTPMLSSGSVPYQFKALLALVFGISVYPFVPQAGAYVPGGSVELVELVPLLFSELLIGIAIGLIASIPLLAVQMGGYVMGYQVGLSLAESFNPELEANGSVTGDLLFYLAAFVFIASGGFDVIFATLVDSFHAVPIGAFRTADLPLALLLSVISSGFDLAMRVATPVMVVVSMIMLAMGFVMKTMPQINIMSIGFAAKIIAGLAILLVSVGAIAAVTGDEIAETMSRLGVWVRSLGADSGGWAAAARGVTGG